MRDSSKTLFEHVKAEMQAKRDEFKASVADWYENGDGRPRSEGGQGWTYPYCEHGTSRWTNYDNICGPCEDGYSIEQLAQWRVEELESETQRRITWVMTAPTDFQNELPEMREKLLEWALSPVTQQ